MNIHHLKQIRKRYEWYLNSKGFPVLIDKRTKIAQVYNVEYVLLCTGEKTWEDLVASDCISKNASQQEIAFSVMKVHLYRYIGENREDRKARRSYLLATKRFEKLKGKKSYEKSGIK